MASKLPGNEGAGNLGQYGSKIAKDALQPGDILLFHNPDNPEQGSHVVIFGGWTDDTRTYYVAYEETRPHARELATPYAYWSNSDRYVPYRYKGLAGGTAGAVADPAEPDNAKPRTPDPTPYPGSAYFGPGANNKYGTQLGRMLAARGAGRYYPSGPGPRWT